jgi:outer membrane protein assembly factor BamB
MIDGAALGAPDTTSPYATAWDTTAATNGSHTLTAVARDAAGNSAASSPVTVTVSNGSGGATFAPGDLLVSIVDGPVQWRHTDGTLVKPLAGTIPGPGEGLRFDDRGDLFVAHWCADGSCATGNTVEHFDTHGVSQGAFGSGYNCNPHDLAFDASNRAYVGLADCSGDIVQLTSGQSSAAYPVTPENRGAFFIDLAADGCTLFYTSQGTQVKRFDACQNRQLADFNVAPLPSGAAEGIRVLPDGGVLVASGAVVTRLNASGALVQSYSVTGESQIWAGLDLVGDGTFWAVNYATSNVYKFDLSSGSVLATFNTGTAANTAVAVTVNRDPPAVSGL